MCLGAAVAAAIFVGVPSDESEEPATQASGPQSETAAAVDAQPAAQPAEAPVDAAQPKARPFDAGLPLSLDEIRWTTDASSTLQELSVVWSIPTDTLAQLNPNLPPQKALDVGVEVIVYTDSQGADFSIGAPNDGRLTRGVPLPESKTWHLPEDRTRAFATSETIAALTTSLQAYGQRFPDAEPVQVGDLSARRGGKISGHQSHQTGRDVDIRLITNAASGGFNAERNWFLVKNLIDSGDVRAIFLNATEQTWLRAAAVADVGAESAEPYFVRIDHEPGHTIHMHVRFACPKDHRRCVGYSQPDTDEQDSKNKLPRRIGSNKPSRKTSKLPVTPTRTRTRGTLKKKRKR